MSPRVRSCEVLHYILLSISVSIHVCHSEWEILFYEVALFLFLYDDRVENMAEVFFVSYWENKSLIRKALYGRCFAHSSERCKVGRGGKNGEYLQETLWHVRKIVYLYIFFFSCRQIPTYVNLFQKQSVALVISLVMSNLKVEWALQNPLGSDGNNQSVFGPGDVLFIQKA